MKPGIKTTELWVSLAFIGLTLGGTLTDKIKDPTVAAIAGAIVVACYSIARALAKKYGYTPPMIVSRGEPFIDDGKRAGSLNLADLDKPKTRDA